MKQTQIHFIIGIGRSGTTLLTSILNQHPRVLASPETYFLVFFANAFLYKTKFTDREYEQLLRFNQTFIKMQPLIGWEFSEDKLLKELRENRYQNYRTICEIIYRNLSIPEKKDEDILHIVDKNPSYSLQAEKLCEIFPSAKFLVAVRDYRANLLSRKQSINVRPGDTVLNCVRWDLFNRFLIRFMKRNKGRYRIIKYENMVTEPEKEVEEMMDFLGLGYRDNLLKFYKREEEKLEDAEYIELSKESDRITKKFTDMARPINTSRKDAWKKELSEENIRIADIICGETGEYFGYEVQNKIANRRLEKLKLFLKHPKQVLLAYYDVYKDFVLYYAPLNWKLRRFEKMVNKRMENYANKS